MDREIVFLDSVFCFGMRRIAFFILLFMAVISGAGVVSTARADDVAPVHRFSCDWGDHFYTIDEGERNDVMEYLPCRYEGVASYSYRTAVEGTSPVHRFWCSWGDHFYTINEEEKNYVRSSLPCTYEGVAWYAYPKQQDGVLPVFRFNCSWGDHFYTMSEEERGYVEDHLPCDYEGIAWYAYQGVQVHGINFGPYIDQDENPNYPPWQQITAEELQNRLHVVAPYTEWVRTVGCNDDLRRIGEVVHGLGRKAAIGAWLGSDLAENQRQIDCLVEEANKGNVDLAIVGSEVLYRGDLSEQALLEYVAQVKKRAPGIPVACSDTYYSIITHPAIIAATDVVAVNGYPYWEGVDIADAIQSVDGWYHDVVSAANGKPVVISETGWPSGGDPVGAAVPSPENASSYFASFVSWARRNDVSYFYFESFDEPFKSSDDEGTVGGHWGIMDSTGKLKPGMASTFVQTELSGDPAIAFTYTPPLGSSDDLKGRVWNVDPAAYAVAVYIYVSGWWNKPSWSNPLTAIASDGSWVVDITTGGSDPEATKIAAFLVRDSYDPPLMSGGESLPDDIASNAVADVETTRSP